MEIGAGVGCLTRELSAREQGKVVCVDLTARFEPILAETLIGCKNVEMVYGDILKQDIRR
ncbi:MAG: rRNA adenine N-6-methyltransferase family protein [Oscillospiraceae bacterium]